MIQKGYKAIAEVTLWQDKGLAQDRQGLVEVIGVDHARDGRNRGADPIDVDVIITQRFKHVASDHLAFIKIKAGDAHQCDLVVVDHGTAADDFVDLFCDLKGRFKVIPVNTDHDAVSYTHLTLPTTPYV